MVTGMVRYGGVLNQMDELAQGTEGQGELGFSFSLSRGGQPLKEALARILPGESLPGRLKSGALPPEDRGVILRSAHKKNGNWKLEPRLIPRPERVMKVIAEPGEIIFQATTVCNHAKHSFV